MGWPSSLASRRASSAAGIAMPQSGRRTARMACVASRRGRAPRRPSPGHVDRGHAEHQAVVEGADGSPADAGRRRLRASGAGVPRPRGRRRLQLWSAARRRMDRTSRGCRRRAVPRDRRRPRPPTGSTGPGSTAMCARRQSRAGCDEGHTRPARRPARRSQSTRPPVKRYSSTRFLFRLGLLQPAHLRVERVGPGEVELAAEADHASPVPGSRW